MTSLHWVEFRFLAPPTPPPADGEPVESRCSAISSAMKVFRSTSWSPLRRPPRHTVPGPAPLPPPPPLPWVGDPGGPERTLMLAMAPLSPRGEGRRSVLSCSPHSFDVCYMNNTTEAVAGIRASTNNNQHTRHTVQGWKQLGWGVLIFLVLPCSAMASLNGWRSVSTEEPVSGEGLARLGASTANRGLVLLLLGGGALPQRKLIKSSLRMVLRRFFTHANTSCKQTNVSIMKVCVHVFPSFAQLNTVHIADTEWH